MRDHDHWIAFGLLADIGAERMHDGFADTESGPEMVVWRFGARAEIADGVTILVEHLA